MKLDKSHGTRIVRWKKNMTVMALFGFVGWFYEINGLPHIPIVSHYIPYPVIYRYISLYIVRFSIAMFVHWKLEICGPNPIVDGLVIGLLLSDIVSFTVRMWDE
jgi:hypothetical protein